MGVEVAGMVGLERERATGTCEVAGGPMPPILFPMLEMLDGAPPIVVPMEGGMLPAAAAAAAISCWVVL